LGKAASQEGHEGPKTFLDTRREQRGNYPVEGTVMEVMGGRGRSRQAVEGFQDLVPFGLKLVAGEEMLEPFALSDLPPLNRGIKLLDRKSPTLVK
jgi:hypothetical protein